MVNRPICQTHGCSNLGAKGSPRKDGSFYYKLLCTSCYRKKRGVANTSGTKKKKLGATLNANKAPCVLCGWNKTVCDRHRLKFGSDGGKYTLGNVVSVCPNCHRLVHYGLLTIG